MKAFRYLHRWYQSPAEYWARSVQRGYDSQALQRRFVMHFARASLKRIKTNSLGEGNLDNLAAGRYYMVGASTTRPGWSGVVQTCHFEQW